MSPSHRLLRNYRDVSFWKVLFRLGIPIALQNLISTSLNISDNLMVGQLGEKAIGALALANQITFLVILFTFGISSGAGVFSAQYWGARDIAGIRRTQGLSVTIAMGFALVFCAIGFSIPEALVGLYTPDPEIRRLGASYLRISALSFPLMALSINFSVILRSVGRIRIPLAMSIVAMVLNIALNFTLIFGLFGLPALGVEGAAIGTLIARAVETTGLLVAAYALKAPNAGTWKELFHFPPGFLKPYIRTTLPVLINEIGWSTGMTVLVGIYAHLGASSLASASINDTVAQLMNILIFGSVNAAAIVIGNTIGEGRINRARIIARRFGTSGASLGIFVGLVLALLSGVLPGLFNISEEARHFATGQMLVFAVIIPFRSFLYHMTVGVFRGSGDTRTALALEPGGVWGIAVPLALLGANVFHLALPLVYALACIQDVLMCVLSALRLRSGRWARRVVESPLPIVFEKV